MAYGAGSDCTKFDERISQISSAMTALLDRKAELIREGRADTGYDSRVQAITDTLEGTESAIGGFDDGMVISNGPQYQGPGPGTAVYPLQGRDGAGAGIINRRVSA